MIVTPAIGDRVERRIAGVSHCGTVHYADELQVLVKWDDGSSSSLRVGIHQLRVITHRSREPVRADRMLTTPNAAGAG